MARTLGHPMCSLAPMQLAPRGAWQEPARLPQAISKSVSCRMYRAADQEAQAGQPHGCPVLLFLRGQAVVEYFVIFAVIALMTVIGLTKFPQEIGDIVRKFFGQSAAVVADYPDRRVTP